MSRSKSKDNTYHHGDLRNTLIKTGVMMLEQEGEQALSLRKLAKQTGVSHNAPYMHFADKEALLAAIAEEGFHILTNAVDTAVTQSEGNWPQQFQNGCWAYVNFALHHPSHLQVMFRYFEPAKYPSLFQASTGALERLKVVIEAGQHQGLLINGDSKQLATFVWSLLHGVSMILAGRKMPPVVMGNKSPQELTVNFLELVCSGIAKDGNLI